MPNFPYKLVFSSTFPFSPVGPLLAGLFRAAEALAFSPLEPSASFTQQMAGNLSDKFPVLHF